MTISFGYWTPVFGGWLRNVEDEHTPADFEHLKTIAQYAEQHGFDLTLVPELNLNDIKGDNEPSLDAWTVSAGLAATTQRLTILAALRPVYKLPTIVAKEAVTLANISHGRFAINIVSGWWQEEARQYGGTFPEHDDRYARTLEFVKVLQGLWSEPSPFTFHGDYYDYENTWAEPKPNPRIPLYSGGESDIGRNTIAQFADYYVTHGGTVEELRDKIADLNQRRREKGRGDFEGFGMAGYIIVRDTDEEAQQELNRITSVKPGSKAYDNFQQFVSNSHLNVDIDLRDYSVSNRGLRPGFVGTPEHVADRIIAYERAGVNLLLLQFSPQLEEMQRFSEQVIPLVRQKEAELGLR
ncbi:LLM class flavin-dependent oxidoreductase [Bifidobacterium cebidarum]|uniref:Alkanesulfonate monooxygenase n=1 Tax=Bifidobacterium cebidarum TaxID=2650773 RepID=A0A6I1GRD7_9BIFI|nr:LLM class flavin-dependent oxidoreductase [Bifidobacterium cebidarum]KAB7789111.1 alkanesulfonate monooxygenase [Bifidobacterium cebidarum]